MAFNRKHLYLPEEQQLSFFARSISHPARLRIIYNLLDGTALTVEELRRSHPLSQPTFTQHIEMMRHAHMVHHEEQCPYTFYTLNEKNMLLMKKTLNEFLKRLDF